MWHFGLIAKNDSNADSSIHCDLGPRVLKKSIVLSWNWQYTFNIRSDRARTSARESSESDTFLHLHQRYPWKHRNQQSLHPLLADDLIIIYIYKYTAEATVSLSNHLVRVKEWLDKWRLQMAVHKFQYLIVHIGIGTCAQPYIIV